MIDKKKMLSLILVFVPTILIFGKIFYGSEIIGGDAPYFSKEVFWDLMEEPSIWTNRGNVFGGINKLIWLTPVMMVYGFIGSLLGNDWALRFIFYIPSIVTSLFGGYLLGRHFELKKMSAFLASLIYFFNTYLILLIDGGQVGVSLAYGVFPIVFYILITIKQRSLFMAIFGLFILFIIDPRVALISVFASLIFLGLQREYLLITKIFFVLLINFFLNMYWIYPMLTMGAGSWQLPVGNLGDTKLTHALFLFQPHWPENIFGNINYPFGYFVFVPVFVFGHLFIMRNKRSVLMVVMVLIFIFLTKGASKPLGFIYDMFVRNFFFGGVFRDSTKFFIPLMLFASLSIGLTVDAIFTKVNKKKTLLIFGLVYGYFLFLVSPAFGGNLNFLLNKDSNYSDTKGINELIFKNDMTKVIWFPERYVGGLVSNKLISIDGQDLIQLWPFKNINGGSYDPFNFMLQNDDYVEWFRLLGVKYLIFSGDFRGLIKNEEEKIAWNNLIDTVNNTQGLEKVELDDFPVYEVKDTKGRFYEAQKALLVVGSYADMDLDLAKKMPIIYFEDGLVDFRQLEGLEKNSAKIMFRQREAIDLQMSFLQNYYKSTSEAKSSQWANYIHNDFLNLKYQLAIRDLKITDFYYNFGASFSTIQGEKINFNFDLESAGDYILGLRVAHKERDGMVGYSISNSEQEIVKSQRQDGFYWIIKEFSLGKGKNKLVIENIDNSLVVLNVVAIIPEKEYKKMFDLESTFEEHFGVIEEEAVDNFANGLSLVNSEYEQISEFRYQVNLSENSKWLIFNDRYDSGWQVKPNVLSNHFKSSLPTYSMINVINVDKIGREKVEVFHVGQRKVRWGIYFSLISFLLLVIFITWRKSDSER